METNDSEFPGVVGGAAYRLETDYIFLAASLCPSPPLSFSSFSCNGNTSKENYPMRMVGRIQLGAHRCLSFKRFGTKTCPNPIIKPELEQLLTHGLGVESRNTFPDMYTIAIVKTAECYTLTYIKNNAQGQCLRTCAPPGPVFHQDSNDRPTRSITIRSTLSPSHQLLNTSNTKTESSPTCYRDTLCPVLR